MAFHVGQKVVCIEERLGYRDRDGAIEPDFGDVGTVVNIYTSRDGLVLELAEFPAPRNEIWNAGWLAESFRPAVEPKAEISFTEGAPKDSETWDNRRKVEVGA